MATGIPRHFAWPHVAIVTRWGVRERQYDRVLSEDEIRAVSAALDEHPRTASSNRSRSRPALASIVASR